MIRVHCTGDTVGALPNIAQYVLRRLLKNLPFDKKAEVLKLVQGERWALSWFDAISSEVNDPYTFEELEHIVRGLGYKDVRQTMPQEQSINVVATRAG